MTYAYLTNPASLREFLKGIKDRGVPRPKVTLKYLESIGFKKKGDRAILSVLKFIGFLDTNGVPTTYYKGFRGTHKKKIMGDAIRKTYSKLFSTYENANSVDQEALSNFFKTETELGARAVQMIMATFKVLCEFADFEGPPIDAEEFRTPEVPAIPGKPVSISKQVGGAPIININIQLELPITTDQEIYDKLFKSLKKHLLE